MKYWREYYLVKHTEKHFGRINIGDLGEIIPSMHLKLPLRVNFNVRMLPKWCGRYGSQNIL